MVSSSSHVKLAGSSWTAVGGVGVFRQPLNQPQLGWHLVFGYKFYQWMHSTFAISLTREIQAGLKFPDQTYLSEVLSLSYTHT
jgi:hypothetical protein